MMKQKPILCPYPWIEHFVGVDNRVSVCCNSLKHSDERWRSVKITDGIDSDMHNLCRTELMAGKWPLSCMVCKQYEDSGLDSSRIRALRTWNDVDYSHPKIRFADIKFNNVCNLACRMCRPQSSSLIYDEFKDKPEDERPTFVKLKQVDYQEEIKLEYCKKIIKNGLEKFKTTGGEPFAQIYFIKLLDWCIEYGYNQNLELRITTNATKISKPILHKMLQFKKVEIVISCDGTDSTYEYIRYPGTWDTFVESVDQLIEYSKIYSNIKILSLHCVLQVYNIFNIKDLYNFCEDRGLEIDVNLFINPKSHELNILYISEELKEEAYNDFVSQTNINFNPDIEKTMLAAIETEDDIDKLKILKRTTLALDKHRNQSYTVLDPRIVKYIESI